MLLAVVLGVVVAVGAVTVWPGGDAGRGQRAGGQEARQGDFFAGFGTVSFTVVPAGRPAGEAGAVARRCALLAGTAEQRQRGLMGARSLAGHDGMIFRFESDTSGGFWMKDTPLPLSIAWFSAEGELVGQADMDPCLDQLSCPSYGPSRPYRLALEVPRGGLAALGVGPGARLVLGPVC